MRKALLTAALTLVAGMLVGWSLPEASPSEPTPAELQRQNAALRDSLAAERGWDTTPPGFIREICEVQNEHGRS